jgi:DNA helicase IV
VDYAPQLRGVFSTIVIDEAQDFEQAWVMALVAMASEGARITVLEDPEQRLYERDPCALPGWVVMKSPVNYRSPKAVVDYINAMNLTDEPIEWGGAVIGAGAAAWLGSRPAVRSVSLQSPTRAY